MNSKGVLSPDTGSLGLNANEIMNERMNERVPVEARNLHVGYRTRGKAARPLVEIEHLQLRAGELVCLLGPNGIGKSTLMRTLTGLQPPLAGSIEIGGRPLAALSAHARARRMSMVLTNRFEAANQTVFELAALGRYPHTGWFGRLSSADHALIEWALNATGIQQLAQQRVDQLSDGQRQRVLIARALAQASDIMFLDEPTAFLDLPGRIEILGLLRHLAHSTGCAIVVSCHDLELALRSADCIWLMSPVRQLIVGAPEDLALSGALETIFSSQDVQFDRHTGAFGFRRPIRAHVRLHTHPDNGTPKPTLVLAWTRRMLARLGFAVVEGEGSAVAVAGAPPMPTIELVMEKPGYRWQITFENGATDCPDSLYGVAKSLSTWAAEWAATSPLPTSNPAEVGAFDLAQGEAEK